MYSSCSCPKGTSQIRHHLNVIQESRIWPWGDSDLKEGHYRRLTPQFSPLLDFLVKTACFFSKVKVSPPEKWNGRLILTEGQLQFYPPFGYFLLTTAVLKKMSGGQRNQALQSKFPILTLFGYTFCHQKLHDSENVLI